MSAHAIALIFIVGLFVNGIGFGLSGRAAFAVSFGFCAIGLLLSATGYFIPV